MRQELQRRTVLLIIPSLFLLHGCATPRGPEGRTNATDVLLTKIAPAPLKVEGAINPVEVRGEMKAVELKFPDNALQLRASLSPLELRLPDKPIRLEGNLLPEKVHLTWDQKPLSAEAMFPAKLPPFVVEFKGLPEGLTTCCGGPARCACKQNNDDSKASDPGGPRAAPFSGLVQKAALKQFEELSLNARQQTTNQGKDYKEEYNALVGKIQETVKKQRDENSTHSRMAVVLFCYMVVAGIVGGIFRLLAEAKNPPSPSPPSPNPPLSKQKGMVRGSASIIEGIVAALIVPGLIFLVRGNLLESAASNSFHALALGSLCLIAAMIGAPFIEIALRSARAAMDKALKPTEEKSSRPDLTPTADASPVVKSSV
jgi:hypothetical protein